MLVRLNVANKGFVATATPLSTLAYTKYDEIDALTDVKFFRHFVKNFLSVRGKT